VAANWLSGDHWKTGPRNRQRLSKSSRRDGTNGRLSIAFDFRPDWPRARQKELGVRRTRIQALCGQYCQPRPNRTPHFLALGKELRVIEVKKFMMEKWPLVRKIVQLRHDVGAKNKTALAGYLRVPPSIHRDCGRCKTVQWV